MFNNPGNKLETIAYVWFFLRVIIGIVVMIYLFVSISNISAYVPINTMAMVIIVPCLILLQIGIAYIESLFIVCFARITSNSDYIVDKLYEDDNSENSNKKVNDIEDITSSIKPL